MILATVMVGTLLVAIVALQALASQASFSIQHLQAETQGLKLDYGELKLQVAELSSPERVAKAAHRMGYVLPTDVQTIVVKGLPSPSGVRHGGRGLAFSLKGVIGEQP